MCLRPIPAATLLLSLRLLAAISVPSSIPRCDLIPVPHALAAPYREAIQGLTSTRYAHAKPKLLGILANDDPAARKYAEWTGKACVNDGIEYQLDQVRQAVVDWQEPCA